jgi:hypothetical protein
MPVVSERQRRYLAATHPDVLRRFLEEGARAGFRAPAAVAAEARRGLELRAEYNRGGTAIGARRATQLADRKVVSVETLRRMVAYFDRHEIDLEAPAARRGASGYPSAGRIAWLLWGGDSGRAWARRVLRAYDATRKE